MIKTIIGLGNPGPDYRNTRHNLGFMIIDHLVEKLRKPERFRECYSHAYKGRLRGRNLLFIKPVTYMNVSGKAVNCILNKHNLAPDEILVIFDDINLPWGEIRIRAGGSSGGHNGMNSIIEYLKSESFPRLRIGIKNEDSVYDLAKFVLEEFNPGEQNQLEELIKFSGDCVIETIIRGLSSTQKKFNKKNIFLNQEV